MAVFLSFFLKVYLGTITNFFHSLIMIPKQESRPSNDTLCGKLQAPLSAAELRTLLLITFCFEEIT